MKKGDIELDYLAKIIIAIAFLLLMAFLIWIFKDKMFEKLLGEVVNVKVVPVKIV